MSQHWDAEKAWLRAAENSAERGVGDIPKAAFLGCGVISEVGPERLILCRSLHTVRCLQERGVYLIMTESFLSFKGFLIFKQIQMPQGCMNFTGAQHH